MIFTGKCFLNFSSVLFTISSCLLRNYLYIYRFLKQININSASFQKQITITFIDKMSEYRLEFDKNYRPEDDFDGGLEHYRIQIAKLQEKIKEEANTYKKRIAQLEGQVYIQRSQQKNNVRSSEAGSKPVKVQNNLSYQLYEKDLQIRQLKAENVKLRQIINNPDKVLIRKPDHFENITQKEQQIIKLRKTIQQLEGKHDGQYLSQQKLKKQNQMLLHEIDQLKQELKKQAKTRFGFNQQTLDPQLMEALRYKKELEICRKQITTLENVIKTRDDEIQMWKNKYTLKNNLGLGYTTKLEDMKLELTEFRDKNKQLNKVILKLQKQNQKLLEERNIARIAAQQRVPDVGRKSRADPEKTQNLARYHQSRSVAMQSMVPSADNKQTVKRTNRYDQFHFSDWESVM